MLSQSASTSDTPQQPELGSGKLKATIIHFLLSLALVSLLMVLLLLFWFPADFFLMAGGWEGIKIVVLVDLVLGPLLTAVVYRRGKPKLMLDLSLIGAIQIAALVFGAYMMHEKRPRVIAYAEQGFFVVSERAVREGAAALSAHDNRSLPDIHTLDDRRRAYVGIELPEGGYGRVVEDVLNHELPDVGGRVDLYRDIRQYSQALAARQLSLDTLRDTHPEAAQVLSERLANAQDQARLQLHRVTTEFERGFALYDPEKRQLIAMTPAKPR